MHSIIVLKSYILQSIDLHQDCLSAASSHSSTSSAVGVAMIFVVSCLPALHYCSVVDGYAFG